MTEDIKIYIGHNKPVYNTIAEAINACDGTGKTIYVIASDRKTGFFALIKKWVKDAFSTSLAI